MKIESSQSKIENYQNPKIKKNSTIAAKQTKILLHWYDK